MLWHNDNKSIINTIVAVMMRRVVSSLVVFATICCYDYDCENDYVSGYDYGYDCDFDSNYDNDCDCGHSSDYEFDHDCDYG